MEFIGYSKFPESGSEQGYWVRGSKVYDVSNSNHIRYIINNPELFDMTSNEIQAVYGQYGEKLGREAKAREAIIAEVASLGWIRVRHYLRPQDYWSIQCDSTKLRKSNIEEFIYWAIEHKLMGYHDTVILIGYADSTDKEVYDYREGGIEKFLTQEAHKRGTSTLDIKNLLEDFKALTK